MRNNEKQVKSNATKKLILIIGIIILVIAVASIYKINTKDSDKAAQSEFSLDVANQITMKVVNVDENVNSEYTMIWLTPSPQVYWVAKNTPEYKTYLNLIEHSKKDDSFLTFTLAADNSSIIQSINK